MGLEINGFDEILKNLQNLALEEDEENRALNAAAKVVQKAVIEEAPQDEENGGTLKKNIKVKRAKDGVANVHSGKAYHSHIIEGGRSAGSKYALKNGKRQLVTWGAIAPNPFFSRGFEKSKEEAVNKMADEIKKAKNL